MKANAAPTIRFAMATPFTTRSEWLAAHPPTAAQLTQTLAGVARRTLAGEGLRLRRVLSPSIWPRSADAASSFESDRCTGSEIDHGRLESAVIGASDLEHTRVGQMSAAVSGPPHVSPFARALLAHRPAISQPI